MFGFKYVVTCLSIGQVKIELKRENFWQVPAIHSKREVPRGSENTTL